MWATWTLSKRAVLYSDEAMTNQIGWLDVTGSGTWFEEVRTRIVNDTDADGRSVTRHEQYRHTDCKTRGFRYKFNIFNTPMTIRYSDNLAGGRFWEKTALKIKAVNAFAPDVPLFKCTGDGEQTCSIETFENSDPVSTLLAAYAISCKLDPKDFNYRADSMCERNLWLGMPPGMSNFVGMPEAEFEARFASYPAPVPVAFATQVAAFAQG